MTAVHRYFGSKGRYFYACTVTNCRLCDSCRVPGRRDLAPAARCQEPPKPQNPAERYWKRIVDASPDDLHGLRPGSINYSISYWSGVSGKASEAFDEMYCAAQQTPKSGHPGSGISLSEFGCHGAQADFRWMLSSRFLLADSAGIAPIAGSGVLIEAAARVRPIIEAKTRYFLTSRKAFRDTIVQCFGVALC